MNNTQSLVVCAFDGQAEAEAAKNAIDELSNEIDELEVARTAIVRKNERGEVTFHEPGNTREVVEDAAGAVAKGVTWFIYNVAGMLGPVAGVTAETETKATLDRVMKDTGFPDAALRDLGMGLHADRSALIAVVDAADRADVVALLQNMGGHVIDHDLPPDLLARLSQ